MNVVLVLVMLSVLLVLVGMTLMVFSAIKELGKSGEGKARVEGGGVLVIGPLPIVFGTSERVTKALMVLAIVLLLIAVTAFLLVSGYRGWWFR